jgi:starch synthase
MRVLSVASEIYPLLKTGGLADVAGALPGALAKQGIEMRTLVPGYPAVLAAFDAGETVYKINELFGGAARVVAGRARGLDLFALDAPHLFNRPGSPYLGPDGMDWPDNAQRYAAFSQVAADIGRGAIASFAPSIVHVHDWQAGLVPAYLRYGGGPKSVITVHNLAFQGHFPAALFVSLGLPPEAFAIDGVEYFGGVGFLKAGLQCADAITTVSPTYAQEICTPEDGMGLDGLLRKRRAVLHGIVNGIDAEVWNPGADPLIARTYDTKTLQRRSANKRAIEERFGLELSDGLLFCVVSRLTKQKGMDLLAEAAEKIVQLGARLAVLGSGDAVLEQTLREAASGFPGKIALITGYDEPLSHLMQAGADAIVIPSRFEPCGLTQLYGLHYGCVPVVARVGGLADTIVDANDAAVAAGVASGIQFAPATIDAFSAALDRAATLYSEPGVWKSMQRNGMNADVTWKRSAARYANLYRSLEGPDRS